MTATAPIFKSPYRFLFIASIGNLPAPYTLTRHSAGHSLLTALEPLLQDRIGLFHAHVGPSRPLFYQTWKCPSLMNVSGPPLTRRLRTWLADQERLFRQIILAEREGSEKATLELLKAGRGGGDPTDGTRVDLDVRDLTHFRPTLVILHDELEASPGQVKVKRGGPEQASLRGHRGLISVMESLRGSGLLAKKAQGQPAAPTNNSSNPKNTSPLAILRIGIGIGRPESRDRNAVADYVLTRMTPRELSAVQAAATPVLDILVKELYRKDPD
jgi:PTH1 family peptidyl-tRNA hydrolase